MDTTNSHELAQRVEASTGIITVTFVKKNGEVRKMNCRMGVTKHLKGGVSTLDPLQYITVFDMAKGEYRAINRGTIIDVKGA